MVLAFSRGTLAKPVAMTRLDDSCFRRRSWRAVEARLDEGRNRSLLDCCALFSRSEAAGVELKLRAALVKRYRAAGDTIDAFESGLHLDGARGATHAIDTKPQIVLGRWTAERRIAAFSASGRKVRHTVRAVEVMAGRSGVASATTACHMRIWSVSASAMKYGRAGPRIVLKPAHPIENAFSMSCSRQHEEDKRPTTVQRPVRTKRASYKGYHAAAPERASGLCDTSNAATAHVVAAIANCGAKEGLQMRCSSWTPNETFAALATIRALRGLETASGVIRGSVESRGASMALLERRSPRALHGPSLAGLVPGPSLLIRRVRCVRRRRALRLRWGERGWRVDMWRRARTMQGGGVSPCGARCGAHGSQSAGRRVPRSGAPVE